MKSPHKAVAKSLLAAGAIVALGATSGCAHMGHHARQGAAVGTVLGAGAGWVVGNNNGHRAAGTAAGALLGGIVGGAWGSHYDYHPRPVVYRTPHTVYAAPATRYVSSHYVRPVHVVHRRPARVWRHHGACRRGCGHY